MSGLASTLKNFTLGLQQKQDGFHKWYMKMNELYPDDYPESPGDAELIDAYREWLLES